MPVIGKAMPFADDLSKNRRCSGDGGQHVAIVEPAAERAVHEHDERIVGIAGGRGVEADAAGVDPFVRKGALEGHSAGNGGGMLGVIPSPAWREQSLTQRTTGHSRLLKTYGAGGTIWKTPFIPAEYLREKGIRAGALTA